MRKLETIVVPIHRDYDSCYALLSDPRNFPRWSPVQNPRFDAIDTSGLRWLVDLPRGRRVMHFAPRNDFGVLDYSIYLEDGTREHTAYLRLIPNEEGCTVVAHYLMRPGMSEEQFESDLRWVENDLLAVASSLESG